MRSSSLQEDAYGNSFSGKYESVFLANQGDYQERLNDFMNAIRKVYASAIGKDALTYRRNRGLLEKDEQMSVLIQRVSGSIYGEYFFPQVAGVGLSFNPYVWNESIDSESGFLRLVLGLGTRAVNRVEDDFTRLVALNKPLMRLETNDDEIRRFSQKKIDLLNLKENKFDTKDFWGMEVIEDFPISIFGTQDFDLEERLRESSKNKYFSWVLNFNKLLKRKDFVQDMKDILETLETVYHKPVDIEFTVNFLTEQVYMINLLQCRPFQIKYEIKDIVEPEYLEAEKMILKSKGPIIGPSVATRIDQIIYIVPSEYAKLKNTERYSIARIIGKINKLNEGSRKKVMLLGPGRWGTSTPSLGIPVSFAEIDNVSIICEISEKISGMIPDVSLGTHFFNNLVELDIMYVVVYPEKIGYLIKKEFFEEEKNHLQEILPDSSSFTNVIKVLEFQKNKQNEVHINMNAFSQKGSVYLT